MTQRKFAPGALNHCYQKTVNGEVLFYSVFDCLVFFTLFCLAARRHRVQVLSLVLMPDHLHHCTVAREKESLSAFVQDYTSHFASQQNRLCSRKEPLFLKPYGSAPKMGDKAARTALIYLGNNGPERKLSSRADAYRWSFLAYYKNPNPFSTPLKLAKASQAMRRAVKLVKDRAKRNRPISYQTFRWMFRYLGEEEKKQLIDLTVSTYNVIDYEAAIAYFGNYESMLEAMRLTKGSEYDIQEEFVGWDDKVYAEMAKLLLQDKTLADIHDILLRPAAERVKLISVLQNKTGAARWQVLKYLRLTVVDNVLK